VSLDNAFSLIEGHQQKRFSRGDAEALRRERQVKEKDKERFHR
jgi:hypothetical protein